MSPPPPPPPRPATAAGLVLGVVKKLFRVGCALPCQPTCMYASITAFTRELAVEMKAVRVVGAFVDFDAAKHCCCPIVAAFFLYC